jgi:hypothetical protein
LRLYGCDIEYFRIGQVFSENFDSAMVPSSSAFERVADAQFLLAGLDFKGSKNKGEGIMGMIGRVKIRSYEKGLYFIDKEFKGILSAGSYWFFNPLNKVKVEVVSQRNPWFENKDLDMIIQSGALKENAMVLELEDYERALVWVDGRFDRILAPGQYALWTQFRKIRTEIVDARMVLFDHKDLNVILKSRDVEKSLCVLTIEEGYRGVFLPGWGVCQNPWAGAVFLLDKSG